MSSHLGGHINVNHIETNAILHLKKKFNIKSIIDVGCSKGDSINNLLNNGFESYGIEGDKEIVKKSVVKDKIIVHDFTTGIYNIDKTFDLGYSTEFMEHVEEKYINNYFDIFEKCKYIFYTAAPKYWTGFHHVNCQNHEYWMKIFNEKGFILDPTTTYECRDRSDMNNHRRNAKKFIKHRGMFFINTRFLEKISLNEGYSDLKDNKFYFNNTYQEYEKKDMAVELVQVPKYIFKSTIPIFSYYGNDFEKNLKCKINIY